MGRMENSFSCRKRKDVDVSQGPPKEKKRKCYADPRWLKLGVGHRAFSWLGVWGHV